MAFKLRELEGDLGKIIQSMTEDKEWILTYDNDGYQIWREQGCVYVLDLDIDIYNALTCVYDENTQDYEIDSDLYLFYEHGKTGSDYEIYNEWGSSLAVCVHNYAHYIGRNDLDNMDAVEELKCIYLFNSQKICNKSEVFRHKPMKGK